MRSTNVRGMDDAYGAADLAKARALIRSGFGRRIRQDAGLSLSELAADPGLGVSKSTLWRWEEGHQPRPRLAVAYAEVLNRLNRR